MGGAGDSPPIEEDWSSDLPTLTHVNSSTEQGQGFLARLTGAFPYRKPDPRELTVTSAPLPQHRPLPALKPKARATLLTPRHGLQVAMAMLCLWLGYEFTLFVNAARTTVTGPLPARPAGVEGFLPIAGLMGLIDWVAQGQLNPVHPAAAVLVLCALTLAFVLRKSFCSWLCPVGTLSEALAFVGRKLLRRNFLLPRWLDLMLMSVKYLLLGFFLWAFYSMGVAGIAAFTNSPYNQIADIKMLLFFVEIGTFGLVVLSVLAVGSVLVQGFWCRYGCPYGALLGLVSWASPLRIRRNVESCIDCGKCARVCPSRLPVATKPSIRSVECTGCMQCTETCPVGQCLTMSTRGGWEFSAKRFGIAVAGVFLAFVIAAQVTGHWKTNVSDEAYRYHIQNLDDPQYGHAGRR